MKGLSVTGVVELFRFGGYEAFLEQPGGESQCGWWVDGDRRAGWLRIGMGNGMLCVAKLPR